MSFKRQHVLQTQWYFSCDCRRCMDPTECETMGNALKCCLCQDEDTFIGGYLLPKNPRDLNSEWTCSIDATHILNTNDVKEIIADVEKSTEMAEKVNTWLIY